MKPRWPDNKKFAFTIVDDTDEATLDNVRPVYDMLNNLGIKTTKTIWIHPPRDEFKGDSLSNNAYKEFVLWLRDNGFEIAFHGAGSGEFTREETLSAIEIFNDTIGYYPKMHINHASNPDGIYWGHKRFSAPLRILYKLFFSNGLKCRGENTDSKFFWGDICKQNVKYIRNRVFSDINTLKYDSYMPYMEKKKEVYSNFWFSSSDGCDVKTFCNLTRRENIDRLSEEGGCCIVYTHFGDGFIDKHGELSREFKINMEYLANKDGWFVPASVILEYMQEQNSQNNYISVYDSIKMDAIWFAERVHRKLFMKV